MLRKLMGAIGAAALVMGVATEAQAAKQTITIGTAAPATSIWGVQFREWARKVKEDCQAQGVDEVTLDFKWNSTAGTEPQMVDAMSNPSGGLDGAAITAVGLSKINRDMLIFQLPGLFRPDKLGFWMEKPGVSYLKAWGKLDRARGAAWPYFQKKFDEAGFMLLGSGDVGAACIGSTGDAIRTPADLNGKAGYVLQGDQIGPEVARIVGIHRQGEVSVPEIATGLGSSIKVINAPPLVWEQLGWAPKISFMNVITTGYGIGALIMSKRAYAKLDDKQKAIMKARGEETAKNLTNAIRGADHAAFQRMAGKLFTEDDCKKDQGKCDNAKKMEHSLRPYEPGTKTAYEPPYAEKEQWYSTFATVRRNLKSQIFTANVYDAIEACAERGQCNPIN